MSAVGVREDQKIEDLVEAAFRKGYQHGANDMLMAADRLAHSRVNFADLRDWVGVTLYRWRHHDRLDRRIEPPLPPVT